MGRKLEQFYSNRRIARIIMLAAFLILVLMMYLEHSGFSNLPVIMAEYLAEAVLIASVADAIAILALSKRFLGLPFTGLIQNKRRQLINGIVSAFESKFIPKKNIHKLIRSFSAAKILKRGISDKMLLNGAPTMGKVLSGLLVQERKAVSEKAAEAITKYIHSVEPEKLLEDICRNAEDAGWAESISRMLLRGAYRHVQTLAFRDSIEEQIRNAVERQKNSGNIVKQAFSRIAEWMAVKSDTLNYSELASGIQLSLLQTIKSVQSGRKADNAQIKDMDVLFTQILFTLPKDSSFSKELATWKNGIISENDLEPYIEKLVIILARWLEKGSIDKGEAVETLGVELKNQGIDQEIDINDWIAGLIKKGLNELEKNDDVVQQEFEKLVGRFIENEYNEFLVIVGDILSQLTDDGLVEKINEVAGGSLQWLRISGAYMGLLAGFVLFCVMRWPETCLPLFTAGFIAVLLVPKVRSWLVITK